ncbi:AKR1D1 [Symbiodinium pilosum]|uniref:AKR1D1 protein n=1 Tax=Symbiodinium pilosum TaxID=2952 RepID=A0A812IV00_SYMPI|nr:AKR1D1 [Symbiodinium pilosum]
MLLRELKVDYVDLLTVDCPPEQVPAAWPWVEEVAREGRARFLGVSNFDLLGPKVCVEVFRKFLAGVKLPPAVLAMEVHPLNTNEEMSDLCQSMGIQVLAYSPLGAPHKVETYLKVLTKSDAREMRPLLKVPELQLLQSIAKRYDASAAQVALRWNLQRGHCIIPKSWNPNHILENTKLFDFCLSPEEMASISKLHKGVRAERFFQASFSTAAKALPQMTRDAHDECRKILNKIRGPGGSVISPGQPPLVTAKPCKTYDRKLNPTRNLEGCFCCLLLSSLRSDERLHSPGSWCSNSAACQPRLWFLQIRAVQGSHGVPSSLGMQGSVRLRPRPGHSCFAVLQ